MMDIDKVRKGDIYRCIVDVKENNTLLFRSGVFYRCHKTNTLRNDIGIDYPIEFIIGKFFEYKEENGCGKYYIPITQYDINKVLESIGILQSSKNKDYGNAFYDLLDEFGEMILVARLYEKVNRIKTIIKQGKQEVKTETVKDTLMDIAAYAAMGVAWLDRKDTDK